VLVGVHTAYPTRHARFAHRFEAILDHNRLEHIRLDVGEPSFWDRVRNLDLFIYWWGHEYYERQLALSVIPLVELELEVPCLPNMRTCWAYDDKIREYYMMRLHGYPMAESWVFWDLNQALDWMEAADLPLVFKLRGGAGSSNVVLVKDRPSGRRLIRRMFKSGMTSGNVHLSVVRRIGNNPWRTLYGWAAGARLKLHPRRATPGRELHKNYVLFQRYLPGNDYDTRVTVIGDRAFAFRRYNGPKDFRASGSGRMNWDRDMIDLRFVRLAFEISSFFRFQSMAYDFLYDSDRSPSLCELSYTYVDAAVRECPGFWDASLRWHEGHFWPQYCLLADALDLPDMRQPD